MSGRRCGNTSSRPAATSGCSGTWAHVVRRGPSGERVSTSEAFERATEIWRDAYRHQMQGELDRAIEVDPDFGNPYNDIGCYLMQQGKLDEAVPWLERAKVAKRYEPRQFPYMNLGRIHVRQGRWWDALREFEEAVRLAPGDAEL